MHKDSPVNRNDCRRIAELMVEKMMFKKKMLLLYTLEGKKKGN